MFSPLILAASLLVEAPARTGAASSAAAKPAVASADSTETISLTYVSANDVEGVLTGQTNPRNGAPGNRVLMPLTVRAWSIDSSRNSLTLVGEREGIDAVKRIIRLFDIPARRLSIELRFVRLAVGADPQGLAALPVEKDQLRDLEARPSVRAWTLPATDNHPMSFRAPLGGDRDDVQQITPRISGDGSVTLIVGRTSVAEKPTKNPPAKTLDDLDLQVGSVNGAATNVGGLLALRRVPSGRAIAVAFPREGVALVIRPTILPDAPAREKRK